MTDEDWLRLATDLRIPACRRASDWKRHHIIAGASKRDDQGARRSAMLGDCIRYFTRSVQPQGDAGNLHRAIHAYPDRAPDRERRGAALQLARHHHPKNLKWAAVMLAGAGIGIVVPGAALAQPQFSPVCGVTGSATAPATITYDPFSPGGLSQATIPLILQRKRGAGPEHTGDVSLVLVAPADSLPVQVTYQGQTVLYQEGATAGRPRSHPSDGDGGGAGSGGEIHYRFGNHSDSDMSVPLNLRVSVPPRTDLVAGEAIYFDILYTCSGRGGMRSERSPVRESRAIRLNVNTVSALQAYYAGSALDFGEIGDATTEQVQASPERFTTPAMNSLRVRSSGPYEVRVRSQNDFRLTFPGGNPGNPAETIRFGVRFLGQDITSNGSFGTRSCARAGVAGAADVLPIQGRLLEGGASKAPSSAYADTVTVTFTPIVTASAAQSCAGL